MATKAIALLLSSASFEWSVSRAIMRFGRTPNAALREKLISCYGLDKYRDLWQSEVASAEHPLRLTEVVKNWSRVVAAFRMRGSLIHGKSTCTTNTATPHVKALLSAVCNVADYFQERGSHINCQLPVRRKPRGAPPPCIRSAAPQGRTVP